MEVNVVATSPFQGQKPGTSGLRKKVSVFRQGHYLHNFVQSLFNSLPASELKGCTLLVSGDGRFYNKEAIQVIAEIAAANGIGRLWIGLDGLCSTPAASAIIREREDGVCYGGIILTASHNPGGPDNDFGIKYNTANGGPALESLTQQIYEETLKISEFKTAKLPKIDIHKLGKTEVVPGFTVEIIDAVEDWMKLMKKIFDFDTIYKLIHRSDFKMVYDGLNGVAGPYAKALFVNELKADPTCLLQCDPLPDFGGSHPDPNLTYAHKLVSIMKPLDPAIVTAETPDFGAAGDGDNDRNMILGKGVFVTPSDSVAIIAAYATECIPYFKSGLKGLSRSMPTSCALDRVAEDMKITLYETPTGWKFFGNLMDAGKLSICGEESFGTGSDHIREKDGLWAVLCWLSILAYRNPDSSKPFVTVQQIVEEFWRKYGRNYYTRYDYEEVDSDKANAMFKHLSNLSNEVPNLPSKVPECSGYLNLNPVVKIDEFTYTDPVDGSVSKNQGMRCLFKDGSRVVWRLSGTGSVGSTIRMYLEKFQAKDKDVLGAASEALKDLIQCGLSLCQMEQLTGRNRPTVIT